MGEHESLGVKVFEGQAQGGQTSFDRRASHEIAAICLRQDGYKWKFKTLQFIKKYKKKNKSIRSKIECREAGLKE